ncbi:hypothetical protein DFJ74DRAFT_758146 [Hyaloraphidium curvatum]|nr:hypothetical protein DFJ74DRAFT_758146 [Hyaloraphidium curvatum]
MATAGLHAPAHGMRRGRLFRALLLALLAFAAWRALSPRGPPAPRRPADVVVLVAMIARNTAHELPGVLANVERLAGMVKAVHVVLVENDSKDGTPRAFRRFFKSRGVPFLKVWEDDPLRTWTPPYAPPDRPAPPLPPSNHTKLRSALLVQFTAETAGQKDLRVLRTARDGYLHALRTWGWYLPAHLGGVPGGEPVDFLLAVDTDMCHAWRVRAENGTEGWDGVWGNLLRAERRWDLVETGQAGAAAGSPASPAGQDTQQVVGRLGTARIEVSGGPRSHPRKDHGGRPPLAPPSPYTMPDRLPGWSVLFANGVCGWYRNSPLPNGTMAEFPAEPFSEDSFGFYCDRFAFRDARIRVFMADKHFWFNCSVPHGGRCAAYPGKWDGWDCGFVGPERLPPADVAKAGQPAREPISRVTSAFGGAALYSAPLLRLRGDCYHSGTRGCEHLDFNFCLQEGGEGVPRAEMAIANRWVVEWEGCGRAGLPNAPRERDEDKDEDD